VDVFQTGFRLANNESTFNVYNFVGYAGPTTESTFAGPTTTLPEILLDTATFPAGTMASTVGPLSNGITPIYADGSQYVISFFRIRVPPTPLNSLPALPSFRPGR
jgi:hypothetical protein